MGTINETVIVGGTSIAPGDLVVLDADGAVAIAATRAPAVLEASRARARSETTLRAQLQTGALSYDLSGLRAVVEGSRQSIAVSQPEQRSKQIMAQHVLSLGMSHSTMVTLDDTLWGEWASQDDGARHPV